MSIAAGTLVDTPRGGVAVRRVGTGDPVMLLHGGGPGATGLSNYTRNVQELAGHFHVLVPDLIGYGDSDRPTISGSRLRHLGDALIGVLDALGLERAHLIGNSLGAAVAARLALDHPERVGRLVLMGAAAGIPLLSPQPSIGLRRLFRYYAPPGPSRERMRDILEFLISDSGAITEELVDERFQASVKPDAIASPPPVPGADGDPADLRLASEVGGIAHRTLLVHGQADAMCTLDQAIFLLGQLPDARLHVFGRCGHWVQWERAGEFNRLVTEFLSRPTEGEGP